MHFARRLVCRNANCMSEYRFVLDEARGEIVCTACGKVAEDAIENEAEEKITYAESEVNHARTFAFDNYTENMGTTIAGDDHLSRMTKAQDPKTKALLQAKNSIGHFSGVLLLGEKTQHRAQEIFKEYINLTKNKPKGANSEATILAVLFLAAKHTEAPAEIKHIAQQTNVEEKQLRPAINKLLKALPEYQAPSSGAQDLIVRYGRGLGVPQWFITVAETVAKNASQHLEGKKTSTVAAASIVLTSELTGHLVKVEEAAKVASLTPQTISNALKEIRVYGKEMLPSDWEQLAK